MTVFSTDGSCADPWTGQFPRPTPPEIPTTKIGALAIPTEQWASINLLGKKVGYSETRIDAAISGFLNDDGSVDLRTRSYLPYLKFDQEQTSTLESDLRLRRVHAVLSAETKIEYIGEVRDGVLHGRISAMGKPETRTVPVPDGVYLPETLPWVHLLSGAKPGEVRQWPAFRVDTTGIEMASAVITTASPEEAPAQAVITIRFAGQTVNSTYTMKGQFLGESGQISGLDYFSRPEDKASAEAMPEDTGDQLTQGEIVEKVSIRTAKLIPKPWDVRELIVKIAPLAKEGPHLDGALQTLVESAGDPAAATLTIRVTDPGQPEASDSPADWTKHPAIAEWLKPSLLIQSEDAEIRAKAQELAKDAKGPWDIAKSIRKFCHDYIDSSDLRFTLPSAIEVLHSGKGDCNEHAALYAALARAAGVPCKSVGGIVYINYGNGRNGFYYHAWNEVAINTPAGPKWFPIDSTLDTDDTDATHVRLVEGDLDQQSAINNMIGNITVEVVEWKE